MKQLTRKHQFVIGLALFCEYIAIGIVAFSTDLLAQDIGVLGMLMLLIFSVRDILFCFRGFYESYRKNLIFHVISQSIILAAVVLCFLL